jgi:hypothetical protein
LERLRDCRTEANSSERVRGPVGWRLLIAQGVDKADRREGRCGDTGVEPGAIDFGEEAGDLVPAGSLAALAGFAYQHDEEIEAVAGGTDHAVGAGADYVAKDGEKLEENGGGVRLSVRSPGADGRAGQAVEGGFVKPELRGWAGRRWGGEFLRCGRRSVCRQRALRGRLGGNRRALLLWVIQLIVA